MPEMLNQLKINVKAFVEDLRSQGRICKVTLISLRLCKAKQGFIILLIFENLLNGSILMDQKIFVNSFILSFHGFTISFLFHGHVLLQVDDNVLVLIIVSDIV